MKYIKFAAAAFPLVVTALITGCGGGGSQPAQPAQPAPAQPVAAGPSEPQVKAAPQISLEGLKFWVGQQGPSQATEYSGPQQQPFLCRTLESNLGQPEVDNQDGIGAPVFETAGDIKSRVIGYSKTCGVKTQLSYFYWNGSDF